MPIVSQQLHVNKSLQHNDLSIASSAADQSGETKKRPVFATGRENAPG
jgi:hypothetical protein